jgi:hypothetical protein
MSNEQDRFKASKRRFQVDTNIKKQVKIAKQHGAFLYNHSLIKEPHRLAKHRAMDCGNPQCFMCGNPRRTDKDRLTTQEKRQLQELDDFKKANEKDIL